MTDDDQEEDLDDEEDDFDDEDDFDEEEYQAHLERVAAVFEGKELHSREDHMAAFVRHLKANLTLPCRVTGVEDFRWEEPYVLGGWDPAEYEELKKTQPSYEDEYELLAIDGEGFSEWMLFREDDVAAEVRRVSDGKEFILGLAELEAMDEESRNHQLIEDYGGWFANSR